MRYIVVYRAHGQAKCETKFYGPYKSQTLAYEALCKLPAIGIAEADQEPGCKYIDIVQEII